MLLNWARASGFVVILVVALAGSLLWAFGGILLYSTECKDSTENHQTKTAQQQPTAEIEIILGNFIPSQRSQAKSEEASQYYECLLAEYTRQLASFTKFLALGTILLVIVTAGLVVFAYWGFTDTRILQRAYVSVEPYGISGMSFSELVAHVLIENKGNLPARDLKLRIKSVFNESGELNGTYFDANESELEGSYVLTPKGKMIQGSESISEPKMLRAQDDIRRFHGEKTHFLYVYGLVTYQNGFGRTRYTRFCHRYNCAIFDQRKRAIEAERARQHPEGNDATQKNEGRFRRRLP
jgi:hypothetical protein